MTADEETEHYTTLEEYRGLLIMGSIIEKSTTWCIEIRVGTYEGDNFISKLQTLKREFGKSDGAINAGMYILHQARAMIDRHIVLDTSPR